MATNELNHYGALNTKYKNYVLQCAIDQNCTMLLEAEITLSFPKYFYAVSANLFAAELNFLHSSAFSKLHHHRLKTLLFTVQPSAGTRYDNAFATAYFEPK